MNYFVCKLFSLRAKSNRNFIQVNEQENAALKANSDSVYEHTALQAIIYPIERNSTLDNREFIIGLRALLNGRLLSVRDEYLWADAENLGDSEKFYVHYGLNNFIGLKSKATQRFLSAEPNKNKKLNVDRKHFKDWEMFEIVPY